MIEHTAPQGSQEWKDARIGVITGSEFKTCRDFKQPTKAQQAAGQKRGDPSAKLEAYAYEKAIQLEGGKDLDPTFVNNAMRMGTEQEPHAVIAVEQYRGYISRESGFWTTEDGQFGLSPDRLVGEDGVIEVKTMVSASTFFKSVVNGDISEYLDQCLGYLWLLGRQWVDLVLWRPDMAHCGLDLTVIRIDRKDYEDKIAELESDLMAFAGMVNQYRAQIRRAAQRNAEERAAFEAISA